MTGGVKAFIEKAIEGGWQPCDIIDKVCETAPTRNGTSRISANEVHKHTFQGVWLYGKDGDGCHYDIHQIVLMPEAWKAVGKVEGWLPNYEAAPEHNLEVALACWCKPYAHVDGEGVVYIHEDRTWLGAMHRMISALAEGKSIEQFLEAL